MMITQRYQIEIDPPLTYFEEQSGLGGTAIDSNSTSAMIYKKQPVFMETVIYLNSTNAVYSIVQRSTDVSQQTPCFSGYELVVKKTAKDSASKNVVI